MRYKKERNLLIYARIRVKHKESGIDDFGLDRRRS
jgi:hypothetical protein